ncbi:GPW/gp25 family protein [Capnocytophaga canis]|uniref:GPW/gp25 family protein n=1 Tax=Capnocytophaga canis TaxID=1848903 RepID=UPI00370DBC52
MKGIYYKLPIDFENLINKKELPKMTLEDSVEQYIFMLMTTSFGECKFDEKYGCEIWDSDFDLLKNDNDLKNYIIKSLKNTLMQYEKRIDLEDIEVIISEQDLGGHHKKRIKKKIIIHVKGIILETNRSFGFQKYFFVSPLSY